MENFLVAASISFSIGSVVALAAVVANRSTIPVYRENLLQMSKLPLSLLIISLVFLLGSQAGAQVQLSPGEAIRVCNTIGSNTGGGVVCHFNVRRNRIEMNYLTSSHWDTFWGSGAAASVLTSLCRETNAEAVYEIIARNVGYRVRGISCVTGRSGAWVLTEPNYKLQQKICEEVKDKSLGRIECSYSEDIGTLKFKDSGVLRATNWTGNHGRLLDTLCQEANIVREIFPDNSINTHQCHGE